MLFWITLVLFIVVIAIGNYLMFNRVLPAINEKIETLPSEQTKQIEKYFENLEGNKKKGFGNLFLRYYQSIQAFMGLLLIGNLIYMSVVG